MLFETSALTCWAALSVPRGALPFTSVRKVAEDLMSKVRNEWAYCDFTLWTKAHYDTSFDLMEELVQNLHLSPTVEARTLDELKLWKKEGAVVIDTALFNSASWGMQCVNT